VVQERAGPAAARGKDFWKVPTGLVDAGEDIAVAAEREVRSPVLAALLPWCGWFLASELRRRGGPDVLSLCPNRWQVFEETGIRVRFEGVIAFRQQHGAGVQKKTDLFFLCKARPLTSEINACATEIARAEWMPLRRFLTTSPLPQGSAYWFMNRLAAESFLAGASPAVGALPLSASRHVAPAAQSESGGLLDRAGRHRWDQTLKVPSNIRPVRAPARIRRSSPSHAELPPCTQAHVAISMSSPP